MGSGSIHRFSIETTDARVDAAVREAKARLLAARALALAPAERAALAIAALAMGDHDGGRDAVRLLGDARARETSRAEAGPSDTRSSEPPADPTALYLLLAARCFAWTGDHGFLFDEWPRIGRAASTGGRHSNADPSSAAIRAAALRELAAAAQDIGRPAELATLSPSPSRTEAAAAGSEIDASVALVLGGTAKPDRVAEWLRQCVGSATGATESGGGYHAALRLAGLVHGVIGAQPDAPRQRLALRPCLPAEWTSLRGARFSLGDTVVAMDLATDGDRRTFTFEQVAGAVPVRLAFEPALPVSTFRAVEVDGALARLDTRPFHGRIVAPVQLVLDHERTVSFFW